MAKYRLLNREELDEMQKEFIDFLVLNGIVAEDWEKMKKESPSEAEGIIGLFSDVIFESIMRKTQYLEYRTPQDLKAFHCMKDTIVLVGMTADGLDNVDFTNVEFIKNAMQDPPKGIKVYTSEKTYKKTRELEVFDLIQSGCTIADDKLFKAICLALPPDVS